MSAMPPRFCEPRAPLRPPVRRAIISQPSRRAARLPVDLAHVDKAEVDLVDDCGGLQGVALAFVLHIPAGDQAQFGIHVLRQPVQGRFVTAAPGFQQSGDFCRACVDG